MQHLPHLCPWQVFCKPQRILVLIEVRSHQREGGTSSAEQVTYTTKMFSIIIMKPYTFVLNFLRPSFNALTALSASQLEEG